MEKRLVGVLLDGIYRYWCCDRYLIGGGNMIRRDVIIRRRAPPGHLILTPPPMRRGLKLVSPRRNVDTTPPSGKYGNISRLSSTMIWRRPLSIYYHTTAQRHYCQEPGIILLRYRDRGQYYHLNAPDVMIMPPPEMAIALLISMSELAL